MAEDKYAERMEKSYKIANSSPQVKLKLDYSSGVNNAETGKAIIIVNNMEQIMAITFANNQSIQIPYSDIKGSDITVEGDVTPTDKKKEYLFHLNVHCTFNNEDIDIVFSNLQKPEPLMNNPIGELNYIMHHLNTRHKMMERFNNIQNKLEERKMESTQDMQNIQAKWDEKKNIGRNEAMANGALMYLAGVNGQIELYKNKIVITRQGLLAGVTQGFFKGNKEIFIRQISGIQVKYAEITNGYIQFTLSGGNENTQGIWQATDDENTVMFSAAENETVKLMKTKIEELVENSTSAPIISQSSAADEIKKFKELCDSGIITQDEFDIKKKQLLGI